jgi:predicted dehydrogenase
MLNVGVIGCGYWGPNIIRNFNQSKHSNLKVVCDLQDEKLAKIKNSYPAVETTKNYLDIIKDGQIDAVAIVTSPSTHFQLAKEALLAGKHAFVEKPLCLKSSHVKELIELAKSKKLVLMVGHTFEYTPAINKLKEIIDAGELGEIYYLYSMRLNLGLYQSDTNVVWDLAPHDLSIMFYLLGKKAVSVQAVGNCNVKPGVEDVAFISVKLEGGSYCHFHISWLDPLKVRKTVIVGNKKMAVFDDIEPLEKIRIYDKGVNLPLDYAGFGEFRLSYNYGDVLIPSIGNTEPLSVELNHFIECIENGKKPRSDGWNGLRVVQVMEAAEKSMKNQGKEVMI